SPARCSAWTGAGRRSERYGAGVGAIGVIVPSPGLIVGLGVPLGVVCADDLLAAAVEGGADTLGLAGAGDGLPPPPRRAASAPSVIRKSASASAMAPRTRSGRRAGPWSVKPERHPGASGGGWRGSGGSTRLPSAGSVETTESAIVPIGGA